MELPFDIGPLDLLDVAIVAAVLFAGFAWLLRSRARRSLVGLLLVGVVYLVASRLGLTLTTWLLQGFFAVFVLVLIVVFQDDLRRLFEGIASWGLRPVPPLPASGVVDLIVRAAARMASEHCGALIVLPGREPLDRHLDGGIFLDGRASEPLILSLFDSTSPGHDGAVVVVGDRIERFAVHLPLSSNRSQLGLTGTRHAAALGLAERSDALCVVVSEERGRVSVERDGRLTPLADPGQLAEPLRRFLDELHPEAPVRSLWTTVLGRWREATAAVLLACALWSLLVPGATVVETDRVAPILVDNLPEGFAVESVEPESVTVRLSGRRRDLYFVDPDRVQVRVDAVLVQLGRRTFQVTKDDVELPEHLEVVAVDPRRVRISVRRIAGPTAAGVRPPERPAQAP